MYIYLFYYILFINYIYTVVESSSDDSDYKCNKAKMKKVQREDYVYDKNHQVSKRSVDVLINSGGVSDDYNESMEDISHKHKKRKLNYVTQLPKIGVNTLKYFKLKKAQENKKNTEVHIPFTYQQKIKLESLLEQLFQMLVLVKHKGCNDGNENVMNKAGQYLSDLQKFRYGAQTSMKYQNNDSSLKMMKSANINTMFDIRNLDRYVSINSIYISQMYGCCLKVF